MLKLNSITLLSSLADRRPAREAPREPASELDSVVEFGKFHYAIQVADLVSDLSQTGASYLDMSR